MQLTGFRYFYKRVVLGGRRGVGVAEDINSLIVILILNLSRSFFSTCSSVLSLLDE